MAEQHNWHFPTLNSIGEVATESFQTKNSYDIKGAFWLSDTPNPKNKDGAIIRYQSKKWKVINMHHVYFNERTAMVPLQAAPEELPVVVPGAAPENPIPNAVYMGYEHPKSHVDTATPHYYYIFSDLAIDHN